MNTRTLLCGVAGNGHDWYMTEEAYKQINGPIFTTMLELCPACYAIKFSQPCPYKSYTKSGQPIEQKILITVYQYTGKFAHRLEFPFAVKVLRPNSERAQKISQHKTEQEAIEEIERLEKATPGVYIRVTSYRMSKDETAY